MYNWRDDRENRYRLRFRSIEPIFADGTENLVGYEGEIRRQTKGGIPGGRIQNTRLEDQRMQNYTLGGNHLFGKLKIDWMGSYAKASEDRPNERFAEYEIGDAIPISADLSDPEFPSFRAENLSDASLSNFELREFTEENQFTDEEDINAFINFELPADFFGKGDGNIRFGARARFKNKNRDNDFFELSPTGDQFATLDLVNRTDQTDPDFLVGSQYAAGEYVSPDFLGNLNFSDASLFESELLQEEFLPGNFNVKEDVLAAYVMFNQKLSDKLVVLGGVRLENTNLESDGFQLNFIEEDDANGIEEEILVTETAGENSYTNILPGLHFKYDLTNNTVLRFAWTNTLARPNYNDIVPRVEIINEDEEIIIGNAALDPTTSMNFDLMAEHYFQSVGILSGGLFYKDINDFIYTFQTEATDNSLGANTQGYNVFQPLNGDNATIFGAEIAFQRQLDFLPGFMKNLSLYLNYTYLTSSADGIRNEDGDERADLDLPNTAPNLFNGSLGYADKKLSARLSLNFSDSYIDEIGGNAFEDRYYDTQLFLDFNASYAVNDNLRFYADLNNITNQPLRFFQGISERTQQVEFYSLRLQFGLKYDLFRK